MSRRWLLLGLVLFSVAATAAPKPAKKNKSKRPPDLERGLQLYERHCVHCHGETLLGDGPATEALVATVPSLDGRITNDNREGFVEVVLAGRNAMPGFEQSFDKFDARRVLRWMMQRDLDSLPDEYVIGYVEPEEKEEAEADDEAKPDGEGDDAEPDGDVAPDLDDAAPEPEASVPPAAPVRRLPPPKRPGAAPEY
jgi:mono/diheme cytochrome c family protein